jgi:hypothetical protein
MKWLGEDVDDIEGILFLICAGVSLALLKDIILGDILHYNLSPKLPAILSFLGGSIYIGPNPSLYEFATVGFFWLLRKRCFLDLFL